MPSIPRFLKRKPIRLAAGILCGLLLVTASIWLLRIPIADFVLRSYSGELGLDHIDFTLSELERDHVQFRDIDLKSTAGSLRADSLVINYSLGRLWKEQTLNSIEVRGAELYPEFSSDPDEASTTELPRNKSELLTLFDLGPYAPLPFDRIQIFNSTISFGGDKPQIPFEVRLERTSPDAYAFTLQAGAPELNLAAAGTLAQPNSTQIEVTLASESPIDSLAKHWPDFSNLPDIGTLELGQTQIDLRLDSINPLSIEIHSRSPFFEYEEFRVVSKNLKLSFELETLDQIKWEAVLTQPEINYDTFKTAPTDHFRFGGEILNQSTITATTSESIQWNYDSDFLSGNSQLNLEFNLSEPAIPFSGTVQQSELTVSDFTLQPFSLSFTSDYETYLLQIPNLLEKLANTPFTHEAPAVLIIPEDENSPIHFSWKSTFDPNTFLASAGDIQTDLLRFDLQAKVGESVTTTQIQLESLGEQPLLDLPEIATVDGTFSLDASLVEDTLTETYDASFSANLSNGNLVSKTIQANGIEASKHLRIEKLLTSFLDREFDSVEELLRAILPHATATLEWQANAISEANTTAQWTGGSVSFQPNEDSLSIKSEIMAGAVVYDVLRFEQLYLDSELVGTLSQIQGKTTANLLFEGVPTQLDLNLVAKDPFSNPYLSGDYSLHPFTLVLSDLPGRLVPELTGSTATATLQAKGDFSTDLTATRSTLDAAITDASFRYPPSKLSADGIELTLALDSLSPLHSAPDPASLEISSIQAGDLSASNFAAAFRLIDGETLSVSETQLEILGGHAFVNPIELPLDGSDFAGTLSVDRIDLAQLSNYVDLFRGRMTGSVSGEVPFSFRQGSFALERGELKLPDGETATLSYPAKGLLTGDPETTIPQKPTFTDRLLKFLKIEPEAIAEEAMSDVTIDTFHAEFFPEDSPFTPLRIRISGTAHSPQAEIPVIIQTNVHGTLSELYNFLIRLNSI